MDWISEICYTVGVTKKGGTKHIRVQQKHYESVSIMIIQLETSLCKLVALLESICSIHARALHTQLTEGRVAFLQIIMFKPLFV